MRLKCGLGRSSDGDLPGEGDAKAAGGENGIALPETAGLGRARSCARASGESHANELCPPNKSVLPAVGDGRGGFLSGAGAPAR